MSEPAAPRTDPIRSAEVVLPCARLDETLSFFESLGFVVELIFPAESPRVAVVSGHGARLRLDRDAPGAPGAVRLLAENPDAIAGGARRLTAPNGTRVDIVAADPALEVPPLVPSLVITRRGGASDFGVGRAGMRYRDLIPDRQGDRFVASSIWIPDGGPVPDYVHHHKVRFQIIYCARGWVRVAYQDQGPPFLMQPGDCVLQPPGIRHRVLESSPDMEVVELSCPAEHETRADPATLLPTGRVEPDRDFGGQRFVMHVAAGATSGPFRLPGWECRDTGIGEATRGLGGVRVIRRIAATDREPAAAGAAAAATPAVRHDGELMFEFVLAGRVTLRCRGRAPEALAPGDAFVVPPGLPHAFTDASSDAELLEVTLPADLPTIAT